MSETNSNDPCQSAHELTAQESRRLSELEEKIHRSDIEKDEYNSLMKKTTSSIPIYKDTTVSTSEKIERKLDRNSLADKPMKFHRLIIYFSLFAGALYSLFNGVLYFTGVQSAQFYAAFPAVKPLDTSFGVVYLCLAVYSLYTRHRLARLKGDGPTHLKVLVILEMLTLLVYLLLGSSAMKLPLERFFSLKIMESLIFYAIYLVTIWIYYDKRKAMFINT